MATTRKSAFGSDVAAVIEVVAVNDKAELLKVPFIIRKAWLHTNASDVEFLYLEVETENDGNKTISDSSTTGVKAQVLAQFEKMGVTIDGEKQDVSLFAPRGLRVSEYEVPDRRGKMKAAKTYYIA